MPTVRIIAAPFSAPGILPGERRCASAGISGLRGNSRRHSAPRPGDLFPIQDVGSGSAVQFTAFITDIITAV